MKPQWFGASQAGLTTHHTPPPTKHRPRPTTHDRAKRASPCPTTPDQVTLSGTRWHGARRVGLASRGLTWPHPARQSRALSHGSETQHSPGPWAWVRSWSSTALVPRTVTTALAYPVSSASTRPCCCSSHCGHAPGALSVQCSRTTRRLARLRTRLRLRAPSPCTAGTRPAAARCALPHAMPLPPAPCCPRSTSCAQIGGTTCPARLSSRSSP